MLLQMTNNGSTLVPMTPEKLKQHIKLLQDRNLSSVVYQIMLLVEQEEEYNVVDPLESIRQLQVAIKTLSAQYKAEIKRLQQVEKMVPLQRDLESLIAEMQQEKSQQ